MNNAEVEKKGIDSIVSLYTGQACFSFCKLAHFLVQNEIHLRLKWLLNFVNRWNCGRLFTLRGFTVNQVGAVQSSVSMWSLKQKWIPGEE